MSDLLLDDPPPPTRRSGELTFKELLRFAWRQLTSMRTALLLLLLLALAAVPGSLIPQSGVDALKTSNWQRAHPQLTPIYQRFGLFSVYSTPWFAAIYLLLMISLVGCILPRTMAYARALRAQPPRAPRNLSRLPDHAAYTTSEGGSEVLTRAAEVLRKRRYRVRAEDDWVSAERGRLREAGNLLFHVSVILVLVGFATGNLFGYRGSVILVQGQTFSNTMSQYDDFLPGKLFDSTHMPPWSFTVNNFDLKWYTSGPRKGMAYDFHAHLDYQTSPSAPVQTDDLRVNHPLTIDGAEVFLIGHGYAPVITVRDGQGNVAFSGPVVFLPVDNQTFESIGVVKAPDARPKQIGLEGNFYPSYARIKGQELPVSLFGDDLNPGLSMLVYAGDLDMDSGVPQSVYVLDKAKAPMVRQANGAPFRVDLAPGRTVKLPDGLGSVSMTGVDRWTKIQISRTPGAKLTLAGVSLALLGLLLSLFIRPRRVWVRVRGGEEGTLVEIGGLDRASGGDVAVELAEIRAALTAGTPSHQTSSEEDT